MAGEIDFRALSPGMDYGQMIQSFGAGQQAKQARVQGDIQARQLVRQEATDARAESERLAMAGAVNPDGSIDYAKVKAAKIASGDVTGAMQVDTSMASQKATQLAAATAENTAIGQLIGTVGDQATYDVARAKAQSMGLNVGNLPPQFTPELIAGLRSQAMTVAQQLADERAKVEAAGKADDRAYNRGKDALDFSYRAGNDAAQRGVQLRGQNMADSRAAQRNGIDGAGVKSIKLTTIPVAAVNGIQSNVKALRQVDNALAELKKYPKAVGNVAYLPDAYLQRKYPSGTAARAAIAEIGAVKIHELSGAAVAASEAPRFQPFVPVTTDTPETVKIKLDGFRRELAATLEEQNGYYNESNGFRSYRGAGARPAPEKEPVVRGGRAAAPVKIRGEADYAKLPSGAEFIAPDGRHKVKP